MVEGKPADCVVPKRPLTAQVKEVLDLLKRHGSKQVRDSMGPRYGVHTDKAFGVPVGTLQTLAKRIGRDHELAAELWKTGWYEARMMAAFIDDPERVTPAQMDRWCRDFDNWGICDTVCFHLFDRTPHAFAKITQWAGRKEEFVKRAAFALLACLALHDRRDDNRPFIDGLALVEDAASDERNFVKKGISWALRLIGNRNSELHCAALDVAKRLSQSEDAAERWIGKDAVRDLNSAATKRRVEGRAAKARKKLQVEK